MNNNQNATKSEALKVARLKWPEHEFKVRHHPQNPSLNEIKADTKRRMGEIEAIKHELTTLGRTDLALIAAARFALAVDGDEPSWLQLATATENAERAKELRERRNELELQRGQDNPRIQFLYRSRGGLGWSLIYADDWNNLLQQIEAKP